jgi:hypothetical protein
LLNQPIQFYKVAASILIVWGIYSALHYYNPQKPLKTMALIDTVFVRKTDTVFLQIKDTVELIKEKIVYLSDPDIGKPDKLTAAPKVKYDCNKEICPNDIDEIKKMAMNNKFSKDTLLTGFIVSVN